MILATFFSSGLFAQHHLLWDYDDNSPYPSNVYQDAGGLVGIGTVAPNSNLVVFSTCSTEAIIHAVRDPNLMCGSSAQPHYILATSTSATLTSPPSTIVNTHFIVNNEGNVGIGLDNPIGPLHIKAHGWNPDADFLGKPVLAIVDDDDALLGAFINSGEQNDPGCSLVIVTQQGHYKPGIAVINEIGGRFSFVCTGDGTTAIGLPLEEEPTAQFEIRNTSADFWGNMVNIANTDNTQQHFTIQNNGYVGIGQTNPVMAMLRIVNPLFDEMHEGLPQLLIDNDQTGSNARTYFMVRDRRAGIGVDPITTGGTLVIKGEDGTAIDLLETNTDPGWNAQLRFIGSDGYARHIITETSDGELLIHTGLGGHGEHKMKVVGDVQIGNDKPISTPYVNTTNGENNLSVNGWVLAKKVIVQESDWSDKVFDANYKLISLSELESFIAANKHLPEIPSEKEAIEKGIDVGEMNKLLLQKVEELTLYVIAQQKQIDALTQK